MTFRWCVGLAALTVGLAPSLARAVPVSIRTGSNTATVGYLEIQPDEYGAWAEDFATGGFGPNALDKTFFG